MYGWLLQRFFPNPPTFRTFPTLNCNFFNQYRYKYSEGTSPCPINGGIMDEIKHDRAEAHSTWVRDVPF